MKSSLLEVRKTSCSKAFWWRCSWSSTHGRFFSSIANHQRPHPPSLIFSNCFFSFVCWKGKNPEGNNSVPASMRHIAQKCVSCSHSVYTQLTPVARSKSSFSRADGASPTTRMSRSTQDAHSVYTQLTLRPGSSIWSGHWSTNMPISVRSGYFFWIHLCFATSISTNSYF